MAQAEELWSSLFSFYCSISPPSLTCRTCRPVISGLITITLILHSLLFRSFGVVLFNICFIICQHWNCVGLVARSKGRTISLVLILFRGTFHHHLDLYLCVSPMQCPLITFQKCLALWKSRQKVPYKLLTMYLLDSRTLLILWCHVNWIAPFPWCQEHFQDSLFHPASVRA